MNKTPSIGGKSLVFNILAIIINLVGLFLIFRDFLAEEPDTTRSISGYALFGLGLIALIVMRGTFLMSYVSRALVGGLFIVSGLIKANDPLGFSYKLEEYFHESALNWPSFEPHALKIALLICIAEIVLGFAVMLGGKIKLASFSLLGMIAFFLWLTYHTASCNDAQMLALQSGEEFGMSCVTDCGCFGDALRGSVGRSLTPWESFSKDAILLYLILFIFVHQAHIKLNSRNENLLLGIGALVVVSFFCWVFSWWLPLFFTLIGFLGSISLPRLVPFTDGKHKSWWMALYTILLSGIFASYTVSYLPVKDYRPYAVGENLIERMNDGKPGVYQVEFVYSNQKTGEEKRFTEEEFTASKIWEDSTWAWKETVTKTIKESVPNSINDFNPNVAYASLPENIKSDAYIDSVYQAMFDSYYQELIALENLKEGYKDTVLSMDYDASLYPDSIWKKTEPFIQPIDPEQKLNIEMKDYILQQERIVLFVMKTLEEANKSSLKEIKKLITSIAESEKPFPVLILTGSAQDSIEKFEEQHKLGVPYLIMDGTEIKIIVRSNPGMVYLEKATVKAKYPHRSIPDWDYMQKKYIK